MFSYGQRSKCADLLNSYSNSMIPDTTPDVIPKYPYLPFSICLDRRGNSKEEILDGIERTMQQLAQADQGESIPEDVFDRSAYNTSFLYQLRDERSREIARIGMGNQKKQALC